MVLSCGMFLIPLNIFRLNSGMQLISQNHFQLFKPSFSASLGGTRSAVRLGLICSHYRGITPCLLHDKVFPHWVVGTQAIPSTELQGLFCLLFFFFFLVVPHPPALVVFSCFSSLRNHYAVLSVVQYLKTTVFYIFSKCSSFLRLQVLIIPSWWEVEFLLDTIFILVLRMVDLRHEESE